MGVTRIWCANMFCVSVRIRNNTICFHNADYIYKCFVNKAKLAKIGLTLIWDEPGKYQLSINIIQSCLLNTTFTKICKLLISTKQTEPRKSFKFLKPQLFIWNFQYFWWRMNHTLQQIINQMYDRVHSKSVKKVNMEDNNKFSFRSSCFQLIFQYLSTPK